MRCKTQQRRVWRLPEVAGWVLQLSRSRLGIGCPSRPLLVHTFVGRSLPPPLRRLLPGLALDYALPWHFGGAARMMRELCSGTRRPLSLSMSTSFRFFNATAAGRRRHRFCVF
ncbi:unnamed protein product [Phaeothamnion confervicola]